MLKLIYKLTDVVSNNEGIELSRDECVQIINLYERHIQFLDTRKGDISNEIDNLEEMYKIITDDMKELQNDEEQETKTV
jgi:hypothetical protein